jgi:hypothetical protein
MRFDKEKLNALIDLPDDELWRTVVTIGKTHGFTLPQKTPPHDELEKLRKIARDGAKMNVGAAMRILSKYAK